MSVGLTDMRALFLPLAMLGIATPAVAQAPSTPTRADAEAASRTLGAIVGGLQSDKVPEIVKTGLFGCLYGAPLGEISAKATEVLRRNPKADANDPSARLSAVVAVCGIKEPAAAAAKAKPEGR